MFNVGGPEMAVIALVALLVLGPEQLPKAMRTLGQASAQLKKVTGGFKAELQQAMDGIESQVPSVHDKPMSPKPPSGRPGDDEEGPAVTATSAASPPIDVVEPETERPPATEPTSGAPVGARAAG